MLNVPESVRKKQQDVNITLKQVFGSDTAKFDEIWELVLKLENDGKFDHPFTTRILKSSNKLGELKIFLYEVLNNPAIVETLPKHNHRVETVVEIMERLKIKPTPIPPLHQPPHTMKKFSERSRSVFAIKNYDEWFTVAEMKNRVDDEDTYCDRDLAKQIVVEKEELTSFTQEEKSKMQKMANPYENVKRMFFQNREALKLAALDRMFGFDLTRENDERKRAAKVPIGKDAIPNNKLSRNDETFYFVDIGGGPGAHVEYILWRKKFYNAKGFGFTLKDDVENGDFGNYEQRKFAAGSFSFFDTYYGVKGNGDLCDSDNLESLEAHVRDGTGGKGVHLVVADASLNPDKREIFQELFHNRLFVAEFIAGVSLCRINDGNFICKLYDTVTPFTVGLIYLMWIAFDEISICKPVSVRPACSEKFLVCTKLSKIGSTIIKDYLLYLNDQFEKLPPGMNITSVVPKHIIAKERSFLEFIMTHNQKVFINQIEALRFHKACHKNPSLKLKDQEKLRSEALSYWEIPDISFEDVKKCERIQIKFSKLSKGYQLEHFYFLSRGNWKSIFHSYDTQTMLSQQFAIQLLHNAEHKLLVSDDFGYIYTFQPGDKGFKSYSKAEYNGFPPRSIVLVQHNRQHFGAKAENHPILIVDAAVLAGDKIDYLCLFDRLKAAKKFVGNVVFRYNDQRIPLDIIPSAPLSVDSAEKAALIDYGILKISPIYRKNYCRKWNKEAKVEEMLNISTNKIVNKKDEHTCYSSFWDSLKLSWKIVDWKNCRSDFLNDIINIHRDFCAKNDIIEDDA